MEPGSVGASAGIKSAADLARAVWLEQFDWDSLWQQIDGRYGEHPRCYVPTGEEAGEEAGEGA